jgi:hypothetical protein
MGNRLQVLRSAVNATNDDSSRVAKRRRAANHLHHLGGGRDGEQQQQRPTEQSTRHLDRDQIRVPAHAAPTTKMGWLLTWAGTASNEDSTAAGDAQQVTRSKWRSARQQLVIERERIPSRFWLVADLPTRSLDRTTRISTTLPAHQHHTARAGFERTRAYEDVRHADPVAQLPQLLVRWHAVRLSHTDHAQSG